MDILGVSVFVIVLGSVLIYVMLSHAYSELSDYDKELEKLSSICLVDVEEQLTVMTYKKFGNEYYLYLMFHDMNGIYYMRFDHRGQLLQLVRMQYVSQSDAQVRSGEPTLDLPERTDR